MPDASLLSLEQEDRDYVGSPGRSYFDMVQPTAPSPPVPRPVAKQATERPSIRNSIQAVLVSEGEDPLSALAAQAERSLWDDEPEPQAPSGQGQGGPPSLEPLKPANDDDASKAAASSPVPNSPFGIELDDFGDDDTVRAL